MTQSRVMSLVETMTNIAIGFVISLVSQIVIFHFYDVHLSIGENLAMTVWFTAISIIRSYCIRRWFNHLQHRSQP